MKKILRFLCGYVRLTLKNEDYTTLLNLFLRYGICCWDWRRTGQETTVCIFERDYRAIESLFSSAGLSYSFERRGVFLFLSKYRKRPGILCGLLLCAAILIASRLFVWDVRVDGAGLLDEGQVKTLLSENGLEVGSYIPRLDCAAIGNHALALDDRYAWLRINMKGTVAHVSVLAVRDYSGGNPAEEGSNLIADESAMVVGLAIERGKTAVAIGDVVEKGQMLASGVVDGVHETTILSAKGEVFGQLEHVFTVEVPFLQQEKVYTDSETADFGINFFGKTINFYHSTGNCPDNYDTIKSKDRICLFGSIALPIVAERETRAYFSTRETRLTETDAARMAMRRLNLEIGAWVGDGEILRRETEACFTESGYRVTCRVLAVRNIAVRQTITADAENRKTEE